MIKPFHILLEFKIHMQKTQIITKEAEVINKKFVWDEKNVAKFQSNMISKSLRVPHRGM